MPNYSNGKIYTIRSYKSDEVYVGSTTQTLSIRMAKHRTGYKAFMNGTGKYVSSFEILKYNDAYIELVILNPCNSKTELDAVEGKYIREMDCVNKRIEGRTSKQYYIDNKVKIKEYKAQHYTANSAKIKERINKYRIDNKSRLTKKNKCPCGGKFTNEHKHHHLKTKKHQLYITMEKMKQQKPKTKITDYYKPLVNSPVILVI